MSPNPDSQREPSRDELIALIAAQAAEIAALKTRIAELERQNTRSQELVSEFLAVLAIPAAAMRSVGSILRAASYSRTAAE